MGVFVIAKALSHKKKKSCNEMSNLIRLCKVNLFNDFLFVISGNRYNGCFIRIKVQHLLTFKLPSAIHQEILYVLTIGYVCVSLTEIPPKINLINLHDITFLFIALFVLIFHEFQNNAFCQLLSQIINIVL